MQLMINIFMSSIIQLLLIIIIPFLWWLLSAKRQNIRFLEWLGIRKIKKENQKTVYKFLLIGLICFEVLNIYILKILEGTETATTKFYGLGISGIIPAIVYAIIQTSLTEEIFFRGFVLKRVSNKFGFYAGNLTQSVLFGLLHSVMFMGSTNILNTIIIILFTGSIAFFIGYINEKKASGSIIPGWIIHGIANILSSVVSLFKLF